MGQDNGDIEARDESARDDGARRDGTPAGKPADREPADEAPAGGQSAGERPTADEASAGAEPADVASAGTEPADARPVGRVPVRGKPGVREPADEASAGAEPADARPVGEGAADEESAGREPEGGKAPGGGTIPAGVPAAEPEPTQEVSTTRLLNGRYRLGAVLGRGGMGTVWHATDEVLGRTVAVKELRLPPGVDNAERKRMITRTLREAKAIATIRSRGVVTIYDVVDEGSRPWIVMELIEGRSLADIIRRDGPMSPRRAARIGLAVLDVLRAAHAAGILHRDVKPSNVIIADEDGRVVLTDFGIAKVEGDPSITSTGMLVGAPSYISPERARGEAPGTPADLWSLGALLFCCVEGRPPFDEGGAIATLAAVMHDPIPVPARAGPLTEVITGLLAKVPADRLAEPAARRQLTAVLAEPEPAAAAGDKTLAVGLSARSAAEPPPARPPGGPPPEPDHATPPPTPLPASAASAARRRSLIIAGVVVVLLALLGAALASTLGGDNDDSGTEGQGGAGAVETDEEAADAPAGEQGAEQGGEQGAQQGAEQDGEAGDDPGAGQEGDADGDPGGAGETTGNSTDPATGDPPPGTEVETDPDASIPDSPAGYAEVVDDDFRFRISLPQGWERTGIAGENSGGIYSAPGGGAPKVQVDFNGTPGEDAAASWRALEPAVARNSTDYERIGIEPVEWRGYPTVADWEFERTENGQRVRVLNRGFRIDDNRGYAVMITCLADEWDDASCRTLRETAFQTFQPTN
jgi:tRNA A-37 threonylcarbamoyl transferase component Bud32